MKGHFTFLWLLLVAVVCFGLFLAKYKVQSLETELAALNQVILDRQEELHVLKAEWAHLSRPERIQRLSERFLHLQPVTAKRIDTEAGLAARLERSE
ncbi:MAG: cell division protein FtsL [Alphaproteobacteria bacterium]|nr:cell division protein FtsL [Alphaproteobacteria bacterium]